MCKGAKKTPLLLLALLLALSLTLAGCGAKPTRPAQSVTPLTCLHPASLPELLALEDGRVLSCWADYEQNVTHLDVVDALRDTVEASAAPEGVMELAQDTLAGGRAVLRAQEEGLLYLWEIDSGRTDAVSVPDTAGVLSHDGQIYYYIDQQVLCRCDTATGESTALPLAQPLRFASIDGLHPTEDWLYLTLYTDPYTMAVGTAVVDAVSGAVQLLQITRWDVSCSGPAVALTGIDSETLAPRTVFSTLSAPDVFYGLTATAGGEAEWRVLPRSPYLVSVTSAEGGESTALCRLEHRVQTCALTDCGLAGALRGGVYLAADNLIVGSVYSDGACMLYLLDPAQLPFAELGPAEELSLTPVDESVSADYFAALEGAPVPDALADLRHRADELEQRYGVDILLSGQCGALCRLSGRDVATSDEAGLADEAGAIARALDALDACLGWYPADFFRQFRSAYGDGGVCLLLTGPVNDDIGTVGFTFEEGLYQCVALDVTLSDLTGTICHELWHATENRITSRDSAAFDEEAWSGYNPDGFSYYLDYPGQPESGKWTLYTVTGESAYFVDDYARTNSHEDRARIMEYIMQDGYTAQSVMDAPALRWKLQTMCEAVRTHFDTNTWGNVRWERLF